MVIKMQKSSELSHLSQGMMLFGPCGKQGISLTRYSYKKSDPTVIPDSFNKNSLILLLNISGHAHIASYCKKEPLENYRFAISPQKIVFLFKKNMLLLMQREPGHKHHFFILEISHRWLAKLMKEHPHQTKKEIHDFLEQFSANIKPTLSPVCINSRALCEELSLPDSKNDRPALWFYAKILDLISHVVLEPIEDFCCYRKERVGLERIALVKKYLAQNLVYPPSLVECARKAGCSSSYLSRTFSEYTGMTMSRYLRNLRLERAAELLRSGKYNVTEAAMAVGYLSLSHFSKAFAEMFGCCPCVFGLPKKTR